MRNKSVSATSAGLGPADAPCGQGAVKPSVAPWSGHRASQVTTEKSSKTNTPAHSVMGPHLLSPVKEPTQKASQQRHLTADKARANPLIAAFAAAKADRGRHSEKAPAADKKLVVAHAAAVAAAPARPTADSNSSHHSHDGTTTTQHGSRHARQPSPVAKPTARARVSSERVMRRLSRERVAPLSMTRLPSVTGKEASPAPCRPADIVTTSSVRPFGHQTRPIAAPVSLTSNVSKDAMLAKSVHTRSYQRASSSDSHSMAGHGTSMRQRWREGRPPVAAGPTGTVGTTAAATITAISPSVVRLVSPSPSPRRPRRHTSRSLTTVAVAIGGDREDLRSDVTVSVRAPSDCHTYSYSFSSRPVDRDGSGGGKGCVNLTYVDRHSHINGSSSRSASHSLTRSTPSVPHTIVHMPTSTSDTAKGRTNSIWGSGNLPGPTPSRPNEGNFGGGPLRVRGQQHQQHRQRYARSLSASPSFLSPAPGISSTTHATLSYGATHSTTAASASVKMGSHSDAGQALPQMGFYVAHTDTVRSLLQGPYARLLTASLLLPLHCLASGLDMAPSLTGVCRFDALWMAVNMVASGWNGVTFFMGLARVACALVGLLVFVFLWTVGLGQLVGFRLLRLPSFGAQSAGQRRLMQKELSLPPSPPHAYAVTRRPHNSHETASLHERRVGGTGGAPCDAVVTATDAIATVSSGNSSSNSSNTAVTKESSRARMKWPSSSARARLKRLFLWRSPADLRSNDYSTGTLLTHTAKPVGSGPRKAAIFLTVWGIIVGLWAAAAVYNSLLRRFWPGQASWARVQPYMAPLSSLYLYDTMLLWGLLLLLDWWMLCGLADTMYQQGALALYLPHFTFARFANDVDAKLLPSWLTPPEQRASMLTSTATEIASTTEHSPTEAPHTTSLTATVAWWRRLGSGARAFRPGRALDRWFAQLVSLRLVLPAWLENHCVEHGQRPATPKERVASRQQQQQLQLLQKQDGHSQRSGLFQYRARVSLNRFRVFAFWTLVLVGWLLIVVVFVIAGVVVNGGRTAGERRLDAYNRHRAWFACQRKAIASVGSTSIDTNDGDEAHTIQTLDVALSPSAATRAVLAILLASLVIPVSVAVALQEWTWPSLEPHPSLALPGRPSAVCTPFVRTTMWPVRGNTSSSSTMSSAPSSTPVLSTSHVSSSSSSAATAASTASAMGWRIAARSVSAQRSYGSGADSHVRMNASARHRRSSDRRTGTQKRQGVPRHPCETAAATVPVPTGASLGWNLLLLLSVTTALTLRILVENTRAVFAHGGVASRTLAVVSLLPAVVGVLAFMVALLSTSLWLVGKRGETHAVAPLPCEEEPHRHRTSLTAAPAPSRRAALGNLWRAWAVGVHMASRPVPGVLATLAYASPSLPQLAMLRQRDGADVTPSAVPADAAGAASAAPALTSSKKTQETTDEAGTVANQPPQLPASTQATDHDAKHAAELAHVARRQQRQRRVALLELVFILEKNGLLSHQLSQQQQQQWRGTGISRVGEGRAGGVATSQASAAHGVAAGAIAADTLVWLRQVLGRREAHRYRRQKERETVMLALLGSSAHGSTPLPTNVAPTDPLY